MVVVVVLGVKQSLRRMPCTYVRGDLTARSPARGDERNNVMDNDDFFSCFLLKKVIDRYRIFCCSMCKSTEYYALLAHCCSNYYMVVSMNTRERCIYLCVPPTKFIMILHRLQRRHDVSYVVCVSSDRRGSTNLFFIDRILL